MVVAALTGAAKQLANWHDLTESEIAAAVAELREIVAGRDDGSALLAEVAGILIGFHKGAIDEPKAQAPHSCASRRALTRP